MAMDYESVSKQIIDAVGGVDNITSAQHCMTRLRLILADDSKANDAAVKKIKGIKGVTKQGGQYQIIVGGEVADLHAKFSTMIGGNKKAAAPAAPQGNIATRVMGFIAGCMTPLLPGMLGTGMIKVVLTILTTANLITTSNSTYVLLYSLGDCFMTFLPIFLAYTAAKKMEGNPVLWMTIAAAMVYPDCLSLLAGTYEGIELGSIAGMSTTSFFGIPVVCATYTSSVIPILLMAPVMNFFEKFWNRVSPKMIKSFFAPMMFCICCFPIAMIVLGPLGYIIGNGLAVVLNFFNNTCGFLTIAVLSAAMPFIVMTGMHYALSPLFIANLANFGCDALVLVTMFCSNIAQGGASLGVALKTKDVDTKSEGLACGISATIAGITEPAMYGINLRYKKPMIAAVIAAGISGLWCGLFSVFGYTMGGSPSFLSLITFINTTGTGDTYHSVIFGAIGGILSVAISFILSFIMWNDNLLDKDDEEEAPEEEAPKALAEAVVLTAPLTGEVVALKDVPDEVFASGALGQGVAILPTEGKVVAPCDAVVTATLDSKHAVGLQAGDMELLIHVGINTVELGGKYYEYKIKDGDQVKAGQTLIEFDPEAIKAAGYQLYTPVLINNSDDYASVTVLASGNVTAGDKLIEVK